MKKIFLLSVLLFIPNKTWANVCGSDFQTFNPTTNGLDFITVHSSKTLSPCILNFGFFLNYSKNSVTYNKNYTDGFGNQYNSGDKPQDSLWGADLSLGFGITDKWDVGFNIPAVLKQEISNTISNLSYKSEGVTEIKINTKYQFLNDTKGGSAIVLSLNQSLIKNNPFSGIDSQPTLNIELVRDWAFQENWGGAINLGYRFRNPGRRIENIPFEPLGNQWIYSLATSYYSNPLNAKLIFEIFGSSFAESSNEASAKKLDSLEWLLGVKKDLNHNVALHLGGGTQLASAIGSPESRLYLGFNWAFGPFCEKKKEIKNEKRERPLEIVKKELPKPLELNANILFDTDSAKLRSTDIPEVNEYFDLIDKSKISLIKIKGHTDSIGSEDYNLKLSQRRAESVKDYLLIRYPELNQKQIEPIGLGESEPIESNSNYQGRQKNRRVEFEIILKP